MIQLIILIVLVNGYWEIYFSAFHQTTNLNCINNDCPYQFKKNLEQVSALYSNCTNPIGSALILNSKQMLSVLSEAINNLRSNGQYHTLTLDLYFLTQWIEGEFVVEYKLQQYIFKYSTENPLKFQSGGCNSSLHQVRTIQIALQDVNALKNLKFSIRNNQNEVLIRNIHLSYQTCHRTCRTCFGENYDQCTSCFGDVNLVDGICRCPIRTTLSGEPPSYYRCLKFCLTGTPDRRERYCKGYEIRYIIFLQLQQYSYTQLIQWRVIYDPKYLNNQNKKLGPYFGVFKNNEGASVTVNSTQFLYPLTAQIYILMCNATPINSGISIYLNSTYYSSFYFDGRQFQTDNLFFYAQNTITFTGCQTANVYLLSTNLYVEQGNLIFSLKGNFTNSNSGWYIIYTVLASSQCPAFCLKCERDYECSICQSGYKKVSDGRCVISCPKDSTFTNNICIKNDQITKYSQYFIRLFFDFTVPNTIKDMFILESSTERDFQKGVFVYWSYIESKAVFGGKYVWATAKFSQKYTILKPHHQLTIQFDAIFGCNFQSGAGYLGYSINNNTETQINLNQTVTIKISHSSSILYIAFQCYGQNNNVLDRYCALADYSIIVHYCSPFCLQCSNENTCITMDTYDTSIIKIDQSECGPQQFLDNQYFRCENCPEECEACFNEYECTQCYYPYQLYITKCILMCKSNQHFNELLNICEACNMKCKQCRNNKDWCIHCEEKHFRILNLNQCVCQSGYYDDNITPKCQVCHNLCISCYGPSNIACTQCIQLDKIQLNGNICDCQDGYYFDYSQFKCDQCNFKCQTCFSSFENSCLSCSNNQNRSLQGLQCICLIGFYELNDFCQQCPETEDTQLSQCYKRCGNDMKKWYNQPCDQVTCLLGFENINNICIPICGDLQINGDEECDDGNQIINDGCLNCRFQCPKQCNTCDQTTVFPCSDICGDGIITGFEECDDGNNIQFDGCYECKLDCQIQCTKCLRGQCYECQTYGWEINIETLMCIENCGDSIVIGREECDDGYNLDENDNCYQCKRLCRNDCKTCTSDGKTCLDCQIVGFKPQNYFCINICGDGYLAKDPYGRNSEECDDFNLINYDGCSSTCKFQCQNDVCKVCENRKCIECIDHYYLDVSKNQCLEKCNDGIVIGKEKCDDMNSLLHDGCYNCQLSCQPSCLICQITGCQSCQIGFRLILNQCINVCGDGLIVQGEDCDDGNISPFDGCHFCKFYCNPNCQLCVLGQCLSCYKEFVMIKGICMFSFHNPIGKVNENHHLFNQNQISNSFISFCRLQINGICLICDDFYYLNKLDSKCESRCGDNVINNLEECEHNLTYKIRVCSACKFQCQDNCKECYFGFCQKCEQDYLLIKQTNECKIKVQCNPEKGLYYNDILNQCYEICGDGIISENEQCEDYNLDPYDGCYDCKYSCYSHCPLCIQGVCTDDGSTCQKGYYFDKETGFCFNVCGDGIIAIPDEECDEINNTDCVNCKKINEKNCKIFNEINKCVACLDNFQIVDEVCQPEPKQICDVQSCVNCQNNICIQSSQTQINNQNQENIILYYCGDGLINQNEFCDDGNFINGDGCDSNCQPSLNSICQLNECIQIFYPSPQIKYIQQIQNCQILTLYYDQYVKLSNNSTLEKYLNTLSGKVENTQVNVSFDSNTSEPFDLVNLEINIKIEYFYKIIDPIFILNFADPSIILNQHDSKQQMMLISIQLPSPNLLSIKEQSTTESIIKFSGYQIQIIAAVILISSITGEFQIIENQIEIIQMLYYYKYINIIKGQNLDKFFETFKIIQLANFFEYIGFLPQTYFFFSITKESSNSIFQADGRSSNFLFGFLQIFFILFIAYSTHIFIKIVIKFANHKIAFLKTQQLKQYQLKIVNKLLKFLIKNNGNQFKTKFEMIFQSLLYEHVINTMLSFQYQNYESTEGKISLILNISLSIWLVLYLMNQETQRCIKLKQTYSCLQKIIFGIILVGCFECPIIQIQLCALNEIFYFSFLYIKKNKIKQINTYKDLFKHLTFFFMDMIYLMHEFQKKDPQQLVILGWIQIGIMSSNLTLILIFDLYQILQPIIQKLRKGYARVENCLKQPKRNFANHELFDKGDSILQPQKI